MVRIFVSAILLVVAITAPAYATQNIPVALEPWRDWVLQSHPQAGCPVPISAGGEVRCAWPGQLRISITHEGAHFEQHWQLFRETTAWLPGDAQHWPQQVTINGRALAVTAQNELPVVRLPAGEYTISGELPWTSMPQYLQLPASTALVELVRNGQKVAHPNLMAGGQLWLEGDSAKTAVAEQDQLQLRAFTKLTDGVPLTMQRVLRLSVSGSERELKLGRALLADTELVQLQSALPARIEKDGSLRVQARAGEWEITLRARYVTDAREFHFEAVSDNWPAQEIWSFEAAPDLRGVKFNGASTVDTSQVDLPPDWQQLPTWLLEKDSVLKMEEQYRGDTKPRANTLSLTRNLWLDFDGDGFTVSDKLDGSLYRGWRLDVDPALQLGRVTVRNQPQLVTQLPGEKSAGVEIRERGSVQLAAVSRQNGDRSFPAVGWREDVDSLNATLNLPPGWQLWHVSGVDRVTQSFVSRWDLWDIFLVMITVVAILRLLGVVLAVIALAVFALSFHQSSALLWLSLPVLALMALRQWVSAEKWVSAENWQRRLNIAIGIFALMFAGVFIDYTVFLVRSSLYPQLEQRGGFANSVEYGFGSSDDEAAVGAAADTAAPMQEVASPAMAVSDAVMSPSPRKLAKSYSSGIVAERKREEPTYDSGAIIQTGPGEPKWSWQQVQLSWSGPVTADQQIHLYMTSPAITRLINLAQLLLWVALVFVIARGRMRLPPASAALSTTTATTSAAAILLLCTFALHTPPAAAADFPPNDLLQELERRLTAEPDCTPNCASINEGRLELRDERLTLRLRIDALADVAVPLPGGYQSFLPQQVAVDGNNDIALAHDAQGGLHIALKAGRHDIVLSGVVDAERLSLAFPIPVRRFVAEQDGNWTVAGVQDAVLTNNVIELRRAPRATANNTAQLKADPVAPFVVIERSFYFRNDWRVETTVTRLAPDDAAIALRIPLLFGEALTDGGYKVAADNSIEVTIPAGSSGASWSSKLAPTSPLTLTSPAQSIFVERWSFIASPQWHLTWTGLAPNKVDALAFYPWPGETLKLDVVRPAAVSGAQQTVESLALSSTPGERAATHKLDFELRASQAGDYRLQLPEGARVEKLGVDGQVLNTEDDRNVVLPVHPGLQKLNVQWSESRDLGLRWQSPAIALTGPAANINLQVTIPHDRWLLWADGPMLGPVLLYWGVLVVMIAIAIVLGKICRDHPATPPLKTWHWILLGLGMSTANGVGSIVVVVWLFALAARGRFGGRLAHGPFHAAQVLLIFLSIIALITLLATIPMSLLSTPGMQVVGNGSSSNLLRWFADRSNQQLPQASFISLPLWVYRLVMLAWSLWLAANLISWLRWGWECLSEGGFWREVTAPAASPK